MEQKKIKTTLQFPNLLWYFRAAHLRTAFFWFSEPSNLPWVQIERENARELNLNRYVYLDSFRRLKQDTVNPFIKTTIRAWYESQDMFGEQPGLSQCTPIWGNTLFTPGKSDPGFRC